MKRIINVFNLVAGIAIIAFFSAKNDPKNPPVARTGAPGETTCQASDCHRGGSFVGTVQIAGVPDTVLPSTAYTITLKQKSNASLAGFELTALGKDLLRAGKLTNVAGTSIASNLGREYIRQANSKAIVDSVTWTFTWTSPASLVMGDSITFYFVSLAANNDRENTGDNVLVNKKSVVLKRTSDVIDSKNNIDFTIQNKNLIIKNQKDVKLAIYETTGKLIVRKEIKSELEFINLEKFTSDIYILKIEGKNATKFFLP